MISDTYPKTKWAWVSDISKPCRRGSDDKHVIDVCGIEYELPPEAKFFPIPTSPYPRYIDQVKTDWFWMDGFPFPVRKTSNPLLVTDGCTDYSIVGNPKCSQIPNKPTGCK